MATNDLTPGQLKVYEVVQRIRMQWTALIVCLILLVAGFVAMAAAIFYIKTVSADAASTLVEGVFGWIFKQVYGNLFPSPSTASAQNQP